MKKLLLVFVIVAFFCSSMNPCFAQDKAAYDKAIENAVSDFLNCRLSKKHNAFSILVNYESEYSRYKINDDLITVSILGVDTTDTDPVAWFDGVLQTEIMPHEYYITLVDTLGSTRLPTKHIIKDGKLFYWHDPDYGLTQEMIDAFLEFNVSERVNVSDLSLLLGYEGYFDDGLKAADYYICKDNFTRFKIRI